MTSNSPRFLVAGEFETQSLAALREELFADEMFKAACDKGLNATLQRTRDGATAETRIQELAGKRGDAGPLEILLYTVARSTLQRRLPAGADWPDA